MIEDVLKRIRTQVGAKLQAELTAEQARWTADPLTLDAIPVGQVLLNNIESASQVTLYPALILDPAGTDSPASANRLGNIGGAGRKDETHHVNAVQASRFPLDRG